MVDGDAVGRKRPRYRSLGPDDYLHSEVYDWVAWWLLRWKRVYDESMAETAPILVPIEDRRTSPRCPAAPAPWPIVR